MDFPDSLAGPILRRTESSRVCIWVATSKKFDITPEFFEIETGADQEQISYHALSVQARTETIELGERLFISLISICPESSSFPFNKLIGYNLSFKYGRKSFTFDDLDLLNPHSPSAIVYGNLKYPTFFIGEKTNHILYGSCRKLHGKGSDALQLGDELIAENNINLNKRPDALFLIGDQIYADDVADPILPAICQLKKHFQIKEWELEQFDKRLQSAGVKDRIEKIGGRAQIIKEFCSFTTNNGDNHLLTVGEYGAMYVLSFSPETWDWLQNKCYLLDFETAVQKEMFFNDYLKNLSNEDEFIGSLFSRKKKYEEQLKDVNHFQRTLPQIRRLLANIPTYMIFDDHDITDDWNISLQWKNNVDESPLGSHIIANGLSAYWAFQGWGNDPEQFDVDFIKVLEKYFGSYATEANYEQWKHALFSFQKWAFIAPTSPKTLFLNTRTERELQFIPTETKGAFIKELASGPQLISEKGWENVTEMLAKNGWKKGESLILVSPVPLYGIRLIEQFLENFILPLKWLRLPVDTKFDLELWRLNGKGYNQFQQWLSKLEIDKTYILSGDAHMASNIKTTISFPNGQRRIIEQFTSSPLKNDSFPPFLLFMFKNLLRIYRLISSSNDLYRACDHSLKLHYNKDISENCLWKEHIHYRLFANASVIETENNLGHVNGEHDKLTLHLLKGS